MCHYSIYYMIVIPSPHSFLLHVALFRHYQTQFLMEFLVRWNSVFKQNFLPNFFVLSLINIFKLSGTSFLFVSFSFFFNGIESSKFQLKFSPSRFWFIFYGFFLVLFIVSLFPILLHVFGSVGGMDVKIRQPRRKLIALKQPISSQLLMLHSQPFLELNNAIHPTP